jgi:cytidylate kinase
LKIYLDATAEERARRRYDESSAAGQSGLTMHPPKVMERDHIDSTRDVAPLKAAEVCCGARHR